MGAYKYLQELWRKKQSDVMRYILRVRTWEYRQLPEVHRVAQPTRIDKATALGFRATGGFCVYRIRIRRGDRRKLVSKGIVYGKPKTQGIFQQKSKLSLRNRAEKMAGAKLGSLRLLNSYWVAQDGMFKYFECVMVDPMSETVRTDPHINWICKPAATHRETRGVTFAGRKSRGLETRGGRHTNHHARPSRKGAFRKRVSVLMHNKR